MTYISEAGTYSQKNIFWYIFRSTQDKLLNRFCEASEVNLPSQMSTSKYVQYTHVYAVYSVYLDDNGDTQTARMVGLDPDLVLQGGPLHLGLDQDGYGVQAVQIAAFTKKVCMYV